MVSQQVQDQILNAAMQNIFDNYLYMQIDTSTNLPATDAVELVNGGTQIGITSDLFNKERDGETLYSNIVDNRAIMQFTLASGEPLTQPINIGSAAIMSQQTEGGGLGIAAAFPVAFTKDNKLKAKFRTELKFIRIGEE